MSEKITSFFSRGTSATVRSCNDQCTYADNSVKSVPEKNIPARKNMSTLKTQTLTKWINEDLAKTNANVWLKHEDDGKGHVSLMKCSICTKFKNQIQYIEISQMHG